MKIIERSSFQCRRCGGCCKQRGDILLMPMDIPKISHFLGIDPQEFLDKYTTKIFIGIWQPVLKAKDDKDMTCIFYEDSKCQINSVKPAPCFYFPFLPIGSKFVLNPASCWWEHKENEQEKKDIEEMLNDSCNRYKEEKQIRTKTIRVMEEVRQKGIERESIHLNNIYEILYTQYLLDVDFEEQVRQRLSQVEDILIFI